MAGRHLDVRAIADKYKTRASAASESYATGAANPRRPWKESAIAAEDTFAAAMTQAISERRREAGLRRTDESKWLHAIETKGKRRYSEGVMGSEMAYAQGMAPYLELLEGIQDMLPPRGPKGDPMNYARSKFVGDKLHELKLHLEG